MLSTTEQLIRRGQPARWKRRALAYVREVPAGFTVALQIGDLGVVLHDGERNTRFFQDREVAERLVARINAATHIEAKYWVK